MGLFKALHLITFFLFFIFSISPSFLSYDNKLYNPFILALFSHPNIIEVFPLLPWYFLPSKIFKKMIS